MKLSLIAATLISGATAAPSLLTPRSAQCLTNSVNNATTSTSPLVTDCQALADSNLSENWIPSEANNYTFSVQSGTCGFKGVFNPNDGSLPAESVVVRPDMVSLALEHAIQYFAVDGRVGATGNFFCIQAGMTSKTGWTTFEVFTVE